MRFCFQNIVIVIEQECNGGGCYLLAVFGVKGPRAKEQRAMSNR